MEHFEIWRQMLAVALVLGGLAFLAFRFGRIRLPRKQRRMRVVERLPLTPQHSIHIVSIDGRMFVLGLSPSRCELMDIPVAGHAETERG